MASNEKEGLNIDKKWMTFYSFNQPSKINRYLYARVRCYDRNVNDGGWARYNSQK